MKSILLLSSVLMSFVAVFCNVVVASSELDPKVIKEQERQELLAILYKDNLNEQERQELFSVVDKRDSGTQAWVGKTFFERDNVEQNYEIAVYCFLKSWKKGNHRGQSGYAMCLLHGLGVLPDAEEAARLFKQAADAKDAFAQEMYWNYCLRYNIGVKNNKEERAQCRKWIVAPYDWYDRHWLHPPISKDGKPFFSPSRPLE